MKRKDTYIYPAIFSQEEGEEIAVVFPDLDCATNGETQEDAFNSARELLGLTLYSMELDNEPLPPPSVYNQLSLDRKGTVVFVDVFMPSVRLAQKNKSVSRTITLPAWLNALAVEKKVNFSQALQEVLLERFKLKQQ